VTGVVTTPGAPTLSAVNSRSLRASSDPTLWAEGVLPQVRAYAEKHRLYGRGR
jgi:hypothetical protein